jgi:Glycine cleavage system T protein (aminomethyltransferase)
MSASCTGSIGTSRLCRKFVIKALRIWSTTPSKKLTVGGIKEAIFSTTGYTDSGGCEIYVSNQDADKLWKAVFEAGEEFGIMPIGLGARDTLRLEMGFCLYGNDIDDTTSPIEAGLGWITKFSEAKGDL